MDLNIKKQKLFQGKKILLVTRVSMLIGRGVNIDILGGEQRDILLIIFIILLMTFIDHAIQPHSENIYILLW